MKKCANRLKQLIEFCLLMQECFSCVSNWHATSRWILTDSHNSHPLVTWNLARSNHWAKQVHSTHNQVLSWRLNFKCGPVYLFTLMSSDPVSQDKGNYWQISAEGRHFQNYFLEWKMLSLTFVFLFHAYLCNLADSFCIETESCIVRQHKKLLPVP